MFRFFEENLRVPTFEKKRKPNSHLNGTTYLYVLKEMEDLLKQIDVLEEKQRDLYDLKDLNSKQFFIDLSLINRIHDQLVQIDQQIISINLAYSDLEQVKERYESTVQYSIA